MPKELTLFHDIFLPTYNDQSPISVESMPGQSSNIDTSYIDDIRRMMINATKVPPMFLGDTENSYHTSASQESYKFARTIMRYQQSFQSDLTNGLSKIYALVNLNAKDLDKTTTRSGIKYNTIVFNPPTFAKVEQISTMVGQADAICTFIVDSYGVDAMGKPILPKYMIAKKFAPFIPWDEIEQIYKQHKIDLISDTEKGKLQNQSKTLSQQVNQDINETM